MSITFGFSQPPAGYYATATGTGYILKTQLFNIIKNNTNAASSSSNYGALWTLFQQPAYRDNYYENDSSLMDVYSEKPNVADAYNYTSSSQQCGIYSGEGVCYNREHTMPQYIWGSAYPMYSDAHFVLPTDGYVNGKRDNFPYGMVNGAQAINFTSTNGSRLGQNTNAGYAAGYTGTVFEPINEFKGDIARCLLYFATRYEDQITGWNYVMYNGTSTQVFTDTFKNILLIWNDLDPVSPYEIAKNNRVFQFQGNRNPYIDNNSYVHTVWGPSLNTTTFEAFNHVSVFPNPTNENKIQIQTENSIDSIELYNLNGQLIESVKNPKKLENSYLLENLNQGFYLLKLTSDNQTLTRKVIVN